VSGVRFARRRWLSLRCGDDASAASESGWPNRTIPPSCLHSQWQRYRARCIAIMAEAIAAFSLAANVIQFIDFGSRVAANFYGYHKAGPKSGDDASDLDIISQDLAQVLRNLQFPVPHSSINETGLGRLAQECQKCAQQLDCLATYIAYVSHVSTYLC
jgi:hypothetical protein